MKQSKESRVLSRLIDYANRSSKVVWISGTSGECLHLNPAWTAFTGQSAENGKGSGWVRMIFRDDQEASWRAYQEAVAQQKPYNARFRMSHVSLGWVLVIDNGHAFFGDDGELLGYIGNALPVDPLPSFSRSLTSLSSREGEVLALMLRRTSSHDAKAERFRPSL